MTNLCKASCYTDQVIVCRMYGKGRIDGSYGLTNGLEIRVLNVTGMHMFFLFGGLMRVGPLFVKLYKPLWIENLVIEICR